MIRIVLLCAAVLLFGMGSLYAEESTNQSPWLAVQTDQAPLRIAAAHLTHHMGYSQYDHSVRLAFAVTNSTSEKVLSLIVHCVIRNPFEEVVFDKQLELGSVVLPHSVYVMDSYWTWRNSGDSENVYQALWSLANNGTARISATVIGASLESGAIWYHDSLFLDKIFPMYGFPEVSSNLRLALLKGLTNVSIQDNEGNGLLHRAWIARITNVQVYQQLIAKGAPVNQQTKKGDTPLHMVRNTEIAKVLLAAGASVNARSKSGTTPLMGVDSIDLADCLLRAGADIRAKDNNGGSVLYRVRRNANLYAFLIAKGAPYNLCNTINNRDRVRTAQLIARREGINTVYDSGFQAITPLHCAVEANDLSLVKQLIQAGANLHYVCPHTKASVVLTAVEKKNEAMLRYLLSLGAAHSISLSISVGDSYVDCTPLQAAERDWPLGVAILKQYGAK